MPSIIGYVDEETEEQIEELIEQGAYEDKSGFVEFAARYTLDKKHKKSS